MNQHNAITKILGIDRNDLILFSAKSRMGKDATWAAIEQLIDSDINRLNSFHP
jgi:hypothetical protein